MIQDKWSAIYSVQTILLSLQSLLGGKVKYKLIRVNSDFDLEPNNESPLNTEAANLWRKQEVFKMKVMRYYRQQEETE
jgi:ubiquitin-conjugating enzyme E2 C